MTSSIRTGNDIISSCLKEFFCSKYISDILPFIDTPFKRDSFPHLTHLTSSFQ